MSLKEIDCVYADKHDLVALYLGGKLADADAEAFEAHYLSCERCWGEMERAGEIRTAMGVPAVVRAPRSRGGRRDLWTPLAAAAVVAVIAVGLDRVSQPSPSAGPTVYRGPSGGTFVVTARSTRSGEASLEWPAHPNAATYVLRIIASDGTPIMTSETPETKVALDVAALPPHGPGVSFLARVEALDATGLVVARSAPVRMPVD